MNKIQRIVLLALVLRLIGIFVFRHIDNYDLRSYFQVGDLTARGINIYPDVANLHHPYFPAFLYVEAIAYWWGGITAIKVIVSLFDLGNLYLVYLLSKKNLRAAFLYAINPVSILIFTLHGQFDAIPLFFLLLSLYLISLSRHSREPARHASQGVAGGGGNLILSTLIFSAAVMIKTWPLLFVISLYKRLRNKKLILLILTFPVLSVLIYSLLFKTSIVDIAKTIVHYQGLWGIWGPWVLLGDVRIRWQKLTTLIFLGAFFLYSLIKRKKNPAKEILNLLFFFFVFTTNFSIQYFSWLMPFLTIIKPKYYWFLTLGITVFLSLSYASWVFPLISPISLTILGFLLWSIFSCVLFFI